MDAGTLRVIDRVAQQVARRFKRRVWWAEVDDMVQEARAAAVVAAPKWDAAVGVPMESYLWRICVLAVRRWCWHQSSPVSGGMHDPQRCRTGKRVAVLEHVPAEGDCPGGVLLRSDAPPVDGVVDEATWRARVRERLLELTVEDEDLHGLHVLLDEHDVVHVAQAFGVQVTEVRRSVARMRARIERDTVLYGLMGTRKHVE